MSLQSAADVPLLISSPNSSSERRISPSWSIAHLKSRLEPITGVPASSQQLSLRVGSQDAVPISAVDEEQTRLAQFPLQPYAEITVSDDFCCSFPSNISSASSVLLNQQFWPLFSCHISTVSVQLRECFSCASRYAVAIRCLGHVSEAVLINISYSHGLHTPHCPSSPSNWMDFPRVITPRGSQNVGRHLQTDSP